MLTILFQWFLKTDWNKEIYAACAGFLYPHNTSSSVIFTLIFTSLKLIVILTSTVSIKLIVITRNSCSNRVHLPTHCTAEKQRRERRGDREDRRRERGANPKQRGGVGEEGTKDLESLHKVSMFQQIWGNGISSKIFENKQHWPLNILRCNAVIFFLFAILGFLTLSTLVLFTHHTGYFLFNIFEKYMHCNVANSVSRILAPS